MNKHTKYWFDTEFIDQGKIVDLVSIGMVCEDGREFYAENSEVDWSKAVPWVNDNVKPHLLGGDSLKTHQQIADDLKYFVMGGENTPQFWAWFGAYDWLLVCQLYGSMLDVPQGWPNFFMDLRQLCEYVDNPRLPAQTSTAHNALNDAKWTRDGYLYLMENNDLKGLK